MTFTLKSRLGLNAIYQVVGQVLPILFGIVSVPILLSHLGHAEFGIFSVVLMLTNFMTLLDLGIGRAVVRFAAAGIGQANWSRISAVLIVSAVSLGLFSVVAMGVGFWALPYATEHWFQVPADMRGALSNCLTLVLLTLPVIVLTSVVRGYLEACEYFGGLNIILVVFGVLNYLAPLVTAFFTVSIEIVSLAFLGVLVARFAVMTWVSWRIFQTTAARPDFARDYLGEYWHFLTWLTLANILGAVIVYMDRFLASSLVEISRLPFYTVPLDFISRTLIVANGLSAVLLPAFSKKSGGDSDILVRIYIVAIVLIGPMFMILAAIMPWALELWLGPAFRVGSSASAGYFLVGCAIATFNVIAVSKVLAEGSSKRLALLYMCELPLYIGGLDFAGNLKGLVGLAAIWAARAGIEYFIFNHFLLRRVTDEVARALRPLLNILLPCYFISILAIGQTDNPVARLGLAGVSFAACLWALNRISPNFGQRVLALVHHSGPTLRQNVE